MALCIGPYQLTETLGRGSHARVRLAEHEATGARFAAKVISRRKMDAEQLSAEVKLQGSVPSHPCVVRLLEVLERPSELVLLLELAEGGTAFDLVAQGPLAEDHARRLFGELLAGVAHLHRHGVVHRDLKLENLLLDRHGNLKIADFGLAAALVAGELLSLGSGSPNYSAPELLAAKLQYAGEPADVWACGVVLFAFLTGGFPFDDDRPQALLRRIQKGKYRIPSFVGADAQDLIARMLTVDPAERITVAAAMAHPWMVAAN